MKTINKTLALLLASAAITTGAHAATAYNNAPAYNTTTYNTNNTNAWGYNGQAYAGVKIGQLDGDVDNADTDKATAYGVVLGYQFDPNWGAEIEYVGTDDADATFKTNVGDVKGDYDAKTYGLYGTYTYNFENTPVYAKGRLGVARTEVKGDADIIDTNLVKAKYKSESKDTSLAGGLGLGYHAASNVDLEANYDYASSDANLWSIGAKVKF